jgi:cytochrome c peroxidase
MTHARRFLAAALVLGASLLGFSAFVSDRPGPPSRVPFDRAIETFASTQIEEGRRTFRYDTFGDEAFWGDLLLLHRAIAGEANGGVGPGVSPRTALAVGLKVDVDALPQSLQQAIAQGRVDLDDPAVTIELLRLNAVVGVTGFFQGSQLSSVGIQCALCHSTVDNSFTAGVGRRLDGWANRDLNVGAIVALAPNLQPFADLLGTTVDTVKAVLGSWGPGKFDAELILDGKAFQPDGRSAATLLPPAFGLAGVNLHTWTGWGSVTHWNAFVSNLEMHGQGTFYDPRLNDAAKFPIAAREGFGNVRNDPDLITAKLGALHAYQLSIPAPKPPDGLVDAAAAERGKGVFTGKAQCATCHVPPLFTEPGWNMHTPEEIGIDDFQAMRSPDERYRTAPLKGLWTHSKGGFYHDGRFATLDEVFDHYEDLLGFVLSDTERKDLQNYLYSLGDATVPGLTLASVTPRTGASSFAFAGGALADGEIRLVSGNPGRGDVVLELDLPGTAAVEGFVYDASGRLVATLRSDAPVATATRRFVWDGRSTAGTSAAPGVYFVRVPYGGREWTKSFVRVSD